MAFYTPWQLNDASTVELPSRNLAESGNPREYHIYRQISTIKQETLSPVTRVIRAEVLLAEMRQNRVPNRMVELVHHECIPPWISREWAHNVHRYLTAIRIALMQLCNQRDPYYYMGTAAIENHHVEPHEGKAMKAIQDIAFNHMPKHPCTMEDAHRFMMLFCMLYGAVLGHGNKRDAAFCEVDDERQKLRHYLRDIHAKLNYLTCLRVDQASWDPMEPHTALRGLAQIQEDLSHDTPDAQEVCESRRGTFDEWVVE